MKITKNKKYLMVASLTCPSCNNVIFSRARHDYRSCSCGEIAVDGGFDYLKVSFKKEQPKSKRIRVYATRQELYDDWNKSIDKFGLIKK